MSLNLDDLLQDAAALSSASVVAPTVSFASPVYDGRTAARMEGVSNVGGFEGTGSPERCYSVVLVNGSDRSLCFGMVGRSSSRNSSFCVRKDCKVKSHTTKKFSGLGVTEAAFFIARVSEATVYSEPSVKEVQVPEETREDWMDKLWTLSTWVRAFAAVGIAGDGMASNEEIISEMKFLADAELFRTPTKKRKNEVISIVTHQRSLPEAGAPELEVMIADGSMGKGGLTRIVARVETSVVDMGNALEEIAVLTQGRFTETEDDVLHMSGAVQNLISMIGSVAEMDVKFEAPTLWGTTSFIGEELVKLEGVVEASKTRAEAFESSVQSSISGVKAEISNSDSNVKMLKILSLMMTRIQAITPQLDLAKEQIQRLLDVESSRGSQGKRQKLDSSAGYPGGFEDHVDTLMTKLTMGSGVKGSGRAPPVSPDKEDVTDDALCSSLRRVEEKVEHVDAIVQVLIGDVGVLKTACADDKTSIKFSNLGFRNIYECNIWIKENFANLRYGLMMDPLYMLDRIFGQDESDSQLKTYESRVKLNIATGAEAAAIKALHFSRPRLFHSGKVVMSSDRDVAKLSKLGSYKLWKSGGAGVRNDITKAMNQIQLTVSHEITYEFAKMPKAMTLATASLNATITFLSQLLQFIDTIYEKLVTHSKFSLDQAWSLASQILDRVCEDLYAPKEGIAAAMVVNDPGSICSQLMWACFRTHDIMAEYIEQNFENHPAISAEYIKFLATNSGSDRVEKVEALMKTMAADAKVMTTEVAKAVAGVEKAGKAVALMTDKYSAANKEVESLKKRIMALESSKSNK